MKVLKEMNKRELLPALIYVLVGLILAFYPEATAVTLGYSFATIVLFCGLAFLYRFIVKDISTIFVGNEFVIGVVLVLGSIYIYLNVEKVVSVIPVLIGILIVISAVAKIQNAIGLYRAHYSGRIFVLVVAVINLIIGLVLVFNPFKTVTLLILLLGIGLIYSGVTDIIAAFLVCKGIVKARKMEETIEVNAVEINTVETKSHVTESKQQDYYEESETDDSKGLFD